MKLLNKMSCAVGIYACFAIIANKYLMNPWEVWALWMVTVVVIGNIMLRRQNQKEEQEGNKDLDF